MSDSDIDVIDEWKNAQQRVIGLMRGLDPAASMITVPACPDWSVRELFAHMIGLDADIVAGGEPKEYDDEWTARQVRQRSASSIPDLVAEWRALTDGVVRWIAENNANPLNDIIIHEQDLRGALDAPGAKDTAALVSIRDWLVDGFADAVTDLDGIELRGDTWSWSSAENGPASVVVSAPDFDLTRALMSRRSANQLRDWTEMGNIDDHLTAFAALGDLPERDLRE